jgi:serine/threonine protein kinase
VTITPGNKLGPYEILAPIGAGGMGEVYRARDPRVGREVAIKVSAERFSERFEREARAVAALNHPNICMLFDVGPDYIVMELVEGETLEEKLAGGTPALPEALEIARQIADALEAAHEKGIIHRDLKPGNIKIRPDGTVKVLDFGLAKVAESPDLSLSNSPTLSLAATQQGVILGTAGYMSPEQARGKPVDKRADIWAFGVILYEMLTGKRLFEGETVSDTLAAVLTREPDWDRVPTKARPVLRHCLQKDPTKRLRDISGVALLLDAAPEAVEASRQLLAWIVASILLISTAALSYLHFREKAPVTAEPMRFEIPPKVALDWSSPFAISPDGHHLAFAALGSDDVVRLWIRDLNSLEARPLAGTESSHIPPFFWSPDSRYIAFGSDRKLKKADIAGGTQTICDVTSDAVTGAWSSEGDIIFGSQLGLWRTTDSGGSPALLTKADRTRHVQVHNHPAILPDGRHFLYYQRADKPENCGIYLGSLDSKPEEQSAKPLLPGVFGTGYAPSRDSGPGQILFMRDRTLYSQRFDERHLKLVGSPVQVAENVGVYAADYGLFSTSTNGVLVYLNSNGEGGNTQISWFDKQGKAQGAWAESGPWRQIALSPNGGRAAVSFANIGRGSIDLWLVDSSGENKTPFTFGQGDNQLPVWSPDGRDIVFASNRDGAQNLYRKPADGTRDAELLFKSADNKIPSSWSSDRRFLLYTAIDPKTKADLRLLRLEGERREIPLLNKDFNEFDGRFSPDLRWIAYTSDESGSNEIYVRAFSSGTGNLLEGKWQVSTDGGSGARWRKDSRELYYRAPDGTVMAVEVGTGSAFQHGVAKPLFSTPAMPSFGSLPFRSWDVTPDGSRFLINAVGTGTGRSPFIIILNWQAGLKK